MKPNNLSVILPTLNEKENIYNLVRQIDRIINPNEIIIVDDNSTDGTDLEVKKLNQILPNISLTINNPAIGLSKSIQKGIDLAKSKYIFWMDADFSHPPTLIPVMWEKIQKSDIIVGSWLCRNGRDDRTEIIPKILSLIINRTCQLLFGTQVTAYTSGFIMTNKSVMAKIPLRGIYGEYCIDFLVRALRANNKIIEIPFICASRNFGLTKTAPNIFTLFKNGIRYLLVVWKLYWNT
jgi:glycosyltransferase involved in cell wall biosynthesis